MGIDSVGSFNSIVSDYSILYTAKIEKDLLSVDIVGNDVIFNWHFNHRRPHRVAQIIEGNKNEIVA
ncbi:hypothetical protein CW752_10835 [Chryseobacterium sp. PMSZPI]|nr:hypothetical protein CW752_10835 [Chryseobacterium sp. PMSZPI]